MWQIFVFLQKWLIIDCTEVYTEASLLFYETVTLVRDHLVREIRQQSEFRSPNKLGGGNLR